MQNYSIKADLLKLQGAFVTHLKGRTATKKCLCIPIENSGLFLGEKGCYLNLWAYELQNPQFTDTHCVKVHYDKAARAAMGEEQLRSTPILGGMHPYQPEQMEVKTTTQAENPDEVPF